MNASLQDERLMVMILLGVVYHALGEKDKAMQVLGDALMLAKPEGFIRIFVDEGPLMAQLLHVMHDKGIQLDYVRRLLSAFSNSAVKQSSTAQTHEAESWLGDPLSQREIEVLELIAEGFTNQDIANQMYLSLHTVKVHARNIYSKLDVSNRTQAVAKAKALGIIA